MTGFVTQPLLCHDAFDTLEYYLKGEVKNIEGTVMPQTSKSLFFWLELLEQQELKSDTSFRSHVRFFETWTLICSNGLVRKS